MLFERDCVQQALAFFGTGSIGDGGAGGAASLKSKVASVRDAVNVASVTAIDSVIMRALLTRLPRRALSAQARTSADS